MLTRIGEKSIGEKAFFDCMGCSVVVSISYYVKYLAKGSFGYTSAFSSLEVCFDDANRLERIDDLAFVNSGIRKIKLPFNLKVIGKHAFRSSALRKINMSSAVEEIGEYAFASCEHLGKVRFLPDLSCEEMGVIEPIKLKIGHNSFFNCGELSELHLPNRPCYIDSYAFNASGLTVFSAKARLSIGEQAFSNVNLDLVVVPNGSELIAGSWNRKGQQIVFCDEDRKKLISFKDRIELTSFKDRIEKRIMDIIPNLRELRELKVSRRELVEGSRLDSTLSFTINGTSVEIGFDESRGDEYIFEYIFNMLTRIGEESIGEKAFFDCRDFPVVVSINDRVKYLGEESFGETPALRVYFGDMSQLERIYDSAFTHSGIRNIKIPSNLKVIGKDAFRDSALREIDIPSTVEEVDEFAFASCEHLEKVRFLPDLSCEESGVIEPIKLKLGYQSFCDCEKLSELHLSNRPCYIGSYAFYGSGLTVFSAEARLSIGEQAFRAVNLDLVVVPNGSELIIIGSWNRKGHQILFRDEDGIILEARDFRLAR
jgi:hypothetical protein